MVASLALFFAGCTTVSGVGSSDSTAISTTAAPITTLAATSTTGSEAIRTDGVTVADGTIHLGILADLTGPFSGLAVDVIDAQIVFWEDLNRSGGIGGFDVELHIADTQLNVATHLDKYQSLKKQVVMFTHSTGTEQTLAIAPLLVADQRLVVPLTWYSGWSDPDIGRNVLEVGPNSCAEAINTVAIVSDLFEVKEGRPPKLAIATSPGAFGQDPATGVKFAAQALGLEVVYDGEAALVPGTDISPVVAGIARSGADLTWITVDPITLATVMAGAVQLGYTGSWTGSAPTFSSRLLDTSLGEIVSDRVYVPLPFAPLGSDVEGMSDVYARLAAALPDRYPSDAFIQGYLQFELTRRVLERAATNGDLTPEGVVEASRQLGSISFDAVSPPLLYSEDPNAVVSRATGVGVYDKELFEKQGGLSARLGDGAVSPLRYETRFIATDVVTRYDFSEPCYSVGGP